MALGLGVAKKHLAHYTVFTVAVLDDKFVVTLQQLIVQHHTVYPMLPPQGLFFEHLVQRAFHLSGELDVQIVAGAPNAPSFDLRVASQRFSIKTETGRGTRPNLVSITKLCTTEREPWNADELVRRTIQHISRYDHMLMLRAVWPKTGQSIHYQLLEIPIDLLKLIGTARVGPVGRRTGRKSLGGDVLRTGEVVFHVHFDGSDGKCQIRNLALDRCRMLREWDQRL